jgi:DNA-binding transcriptional regulator/RsmH inhibitor MraZ
MSLQRKDRPFTGKFTGRLDEKNRLTIPAAWRASIAEGEDYLAMFYPPSGAILVLPPGMAEKIILASEQVPLSNHEGYAVLSRLGECSETVSCDKAGRVTLRGEMLAQARIEKEVRFTGLFRVFQILSTTPPPPDTASPDAEFFLRALGKIGL